MFGAYRLDHDTADVEPLAGRDLHDVVSGPAHELPESFWHDEPWAPAKPPEGRQVQVIVMRVRDEDNVHIDLLDEVRHVRGVAVEEAQPINEQRVGENADAIHRDEDSRVSEVTNMREHGPSLMLK